MKSSRGLAVVALVVGLLVACGSKVDGTDTPDGGDGGSATGEGGPGTLPDGAPIPTDGGIVLADGAIVGCTPLVLADGTTPQCSDCKDNDGDGLVDWFDPECAGPLDNDEKTFGTGIPGDNQDACKQDCFFDGNSGAGDDRCEWNLKCDPKNTSGQCAYDANFKNCPTTQEAQCKSFCLGRTPNGCDCFGCCAVQKSDGSQVTVRLSSTCSVADIDDPTKCTPCAQVADCTNPCDRCELCIGKTQIPADCATSPAPDGAPPPAGGQTCSNGAQVCNATTACPGGSYCVTGCCVAIIR
ncbi:MAG: hypothetical protein U0183_06720 [Polyangiaceae bacterium]